MEWEDEFCELENDAEEEQRCDPQVEAVESKIALLFKENPTAVFYLKQLQVKLEREYFHWVTGFAVRDLIAIGFLGEEMVRAGGTANVLVKFLFRPGHRFRKTQIKRACRILAAYSEPDVSRACGKQAEVLFLSALLKAGFTFKGEGTRNNGERRWTETDHDLDFVVTRDQISYGCEVKNRLEYIGREELEIKIRMCKFLELRPLFFMRAAAKSYNNIIITARGYAWIFASQIYPLGQEALVNQMVKELGLPVVCSAAIPQGMVDRFLKWHGRNLQM